MKIYVLNFVWYLNESENMALSINFANNPRVIGKLDTDIGCR